ncbi:MAG: vitamin K epoxide reductase family protein [Bifidobacteriaceae bacterium]|jgi:uncharacterized membrane protein|nr:vitamin K epoxide reductase family protein [Bifidobacteriaceae bacterium]
MNGEIANELDSWAKAGNLRLPSDVDSDPEDLHFFSARGWLMGTFILFSIGGFIASFMLTIDYIHLLRFPNDQLECDLNAVISCSTVAESWQSTLLTLWGKVVPNAVLGLVAYTIFIVIGVLVWAKAKLPRWFMNAANLGLFGALAFSYWLMGQSMFVIRALCPWCITMMVSTTFMFLSLTKWNLLKEYIPLPKPIKRFTDTLIRTRIDNFIAVIVALIIAGVLILDYYLTIMPK